MSDTAAVRALRTMDLIPYILEHPGISINQLSKNFAVTEKEIEKDLQLAFMCGLPGYTPYELIDLTYEDGVVSIIDPQVLNKPRSFSSNERVVIALGLEILKNINSSNDDNLKKIENLSKKFMDEESGDSVMIVEQNLTFPFLNIINQAVFETRVIVFDYQSISKDVLSNRKVAPYKLFLQNGNLYLSGYDYHAQSDRIFKADQIVNCAIGNQANLGQANSPQKEETVELVVDLKAVNFIERNSTIIIDQKMRNGQLHVKLKVSNFDWLKRAILSNAPSIKVISPQSLASEVEQMASDLISAYSGLSKNVG
jgi:predicted DNA-binding transcriptional regulator YafY